jgi:hypothetical protein
MIAVRTSPISGLHGGIGAFLFLTKMDDTFGQANRMPFGCPRILRTVGTFFREAHYSERRNDKTENSPEKFVIHFPVEE